MGEYNEFMPQCNQLFRWAWEENRRGDVHEGMMESRLQNSLSVLRVYLLLGSQWRYMGCSDFRHICSGDRMQRSAAADCHSPVAAAATAAAAAAAAFVPPLKKNMSSTGVVMTCPSLLLTC
jgi:hypothetical protein